jgi:alkylation response protein AidB-like acyl-CoA dehydrogenase
VDDGGSPQGGTELAQREPAAAPARGFLAAERRALETFLPGLDAELSARTLEELEAREGPAIELFRAAGGPGLLIPSGAGGQGASAVDAVRVQRAIGSRSPSLAVASTMHHFSLAGLVTLARESEGGLEWMLLQGVAEAKLLVASAFAEGKSGQGIFTPTMRARRSNGKWLLSGQKKPCSLAHSMNVLTASVVLEGDGPDRFGLAIVSADSPNIRVEPFWRSPVLAGAQSEAVILEDVEVEDDLIIEDEGGDAGMDTVQSASMVWFELLMTASYLGMASALVERALQAGKAEATSKVEAAMEVESTMAALEGVARGLDAGDDVEAVLLRALLVRYSAQEALSRAVTAAVEQLGGMAFIGGTEVAYLATATRALAFHPPPRLRSSDALVEAIGGGPLVIG